MSEAPATSNSQNIWLERMRLNGQTLGAVTYGIFLTLTIQCVDIMINRPRLGQRRWPMFLYVAILFSLGTITFAGDVKYDQTTWVDDRDLPGGPDALIVNQDESAIERMVVVSCMMMRWFSDGLLVWRCAVVWRTERIYYLVMVLPVLTFLANIGEIVYASTSPHGVLNKGSQLKAVGILMLVQIWQNALFSGIAFAVPDFSLSVALNVLVTLLIVGRLLATRRAVRAVLDPEHSKDYTSIAAVLIESAALYSVTGLIFIITFARRSIVQDLVLPPLGLVQGIAPMLIILRVAQGRAWSNDISTTVDFVSQTQHSASTSPTFLSNEGHHFDEDHVSFEIPTGLNEEKFELGGRASVLRSAERRTVEPGS